jgi:phenylpyruvate tautomerase PptA (4-oxalocrotonate tautomerase family)
VFCKASATFFGEQKFMPYLKIQTNVNVPENRMKSTMAKLSQLTAKQLGKPESYVMVALQPGIAMMLGGNPDPLAFVELKSIGLPESKTSSLSKAICEALESELNIRKDRIYIEFANADGGMWGWNGGTF